MATDRFSRMQRRDFLKLTGAMTAFSLTHRALAGPSRRISVIVDASDPIASSDPVKWAAGQLRNALVDKGCPLRYRSVSGSSQGLDLLRRGGQCRLKPGPQFPAGRRGPHQPGEHPSHPRASAQERRRSGSPRPDQEDLSMDCWSWRSGSNSTPDPAAALHLNGTVEEEPANEVRSVARAFCSEIEDKPWYYDKDFWRGYLDVLAASRFNRFSFTFGIGYDFPRGVTGDYFHFPYPYLVDVPGYDVRVVRLANEAGEQNLAPFTAEEREKNLQMLRFIAAETGARGLEFQLGIWTHAYEWTDSPHAHHRIEGLTPETHAAYCRDALAMLLKACPQIQGLTLRVHGESGIPEGSYPFWKTLFEAISGCGRKIEIDMHAKGVNQTMIDMATDTGMPVKLGAKYSAEHQSLGYNQADIRATGDTGA